MRRNNLQADVVIFTQAVSQLLRRVRATTSSHELSLTESSVLGRLARDGPATTADLARAESMKPQSMGTTIAVLERRHIVERKPHPTDRRQMYIQLTERGAELRNSIKAARRTWLVEAIAQLDDEDQGTLFAAAQIIQRLVDR